MSSATILFVDDEQNILSSLRRMMRRSDFDCLFATSGAEALTLLETQPVDIVVSDMRMPEMSGDQLLAEVARRYPETIRIVLSAYSEESAIMAAINEGRIWGFIHKPWNDAELQQVLSHALQTQQVIAERALLRRTLSRYQDHHKNTYADFIGGSIAMQFVYSAIEKAAPSRASAFITGESGTGKELAAKALHDNSPRRDGPFIPINCAAIPSELMESEIFGHVKGAFSGAVSNREGAATLADGGTLFLDELGEMDMLLQSKLLRFIQTGTFQKVGSGKTEKVDIRFVCATNRDPLEAIQEKKLREDLYYRLNVISISLPPLRERDDDVLVLAKTFLARFSDEEGKSLVGFSSDAEKRMLAYGWPGNVRQLENCVHSMVIMSAGPLLTDQDLANALSLRLSDLSSLPSSDSVSPLPAAPQPANPPPSQPERRDLEKADATEPADILPLADIERHAIETAIEHCDGNVVRAAGLLQVSPSTLYRKIQAWSATD